MNVMKTVSTVSYTHLCHGEITGIVDPDEVTKEDIGLLMTGKKAQEVDE